MAHLDYGRIKDLELLTKEYEKTSFKHDRDDIERSIRRIMNVSPEIAKLREDLVLATRARDRKSISKIVMKINKIRQDETYGKEIS